MKNLFSRTLDLAISLFKDLSLKNLLSVVLVGILFLGTSISSAQADQSLGERTRNRVEQFDRDTERPKTTGEWLDEVEGDVPLGERVKNTVRDSAEAFQQFGKEYSVGAQESARNVRDQAGSALRD